MNYDKLFSCCMECFRPHQHSTTVWVRVEGGTYWRPVYGESEDLLPVLRYHPSVLSSAYSHDSHLHQDLPGVLAHSPRRGTVKASYFHSTVPACYACTSVPSEVSNVKVWHLKNVDISTILKVHFMIFWTFFSIEILDICGFFGSFFNMAVLMAISERMFQTLFTHCCNWYGTSII